MSVDHQAARRHIDAVAGFDVALEPGLQLILPLEECIERGPVGRFFELLKQLRAVFAGGDGTTVEQDKGDEGETEAAHDESPFLSINRSQDFRVPHP